MSEIRKLLLSEIDVSRSVPVRARLDPSVLTDYIEILVGGGEFDRPLVVFKDGPVYRLSEGFYRLEAMKKVGRTEAECEVILGGEAAAFAAGYNSNRLHGDRYTNADKARAVRLFLKFYPAWTDSQVARATGVSHTMVAKVRKAVESPQRSLPVFPNPLSPLPPPPPPVPVAKPARVTEPIEDHANANANDDDANDDANDDDDAKAVARVRPDEAVEAVRLVLKKLRGVRRLLSEVMAGPFAGVLREVAAHRPAWMLNATGGLLMSGSHGSVSYGVGEYTTDPLDELLQFFGATKLALSRAAARDAPADNTDPDPWDFGQEAKGGDGAIDF